MLFTDHDGDSAARSSGPPGTPLPHLARSIMTMVLAGYLLLGLITIYAGQPSRLDFAVEALFVAGVFVLQFAHASSAAPSWRPRRKVLTLGAQTVFTFAPLLLFRQSWGGAAGFLAGSCLLLVDGWAAWLLFPVPIGLVLLSSLAAGIPLSRTAGYTGSTFLTGLVVYGLSRLSNMVTEVHSAREKMARMAVVNERLRIASDLHDLLGYSLSAIALKGELTRRMIYENPARALTEIHSVLEISRQALSDIRTVAQGYRDMCLASEAASAQAILTAADIKTTVSISTGPIPKKQDTVLASALREGVTNMLRHGDAATCSITAVRHGGTIVLDIVNDGVRPPDGTPPARTGTGLESIARRVATVGGSVSARTTAEGMFHLTVSVLTDDGPQPVPVLASTGDSSCLRPTGGKPAAILTDA